MCVSLYMFRLPMLEEGCLYVKCQTQLREMLIHREHSYKFLNKLPWNSRRAGHIPVYKRVRPKSPLAQKETDKDLCSSPSGTKIWTLQWHHLIPWPSAKHEWVKKKKAFLCCFFLKRESLNGSFKIWLLYGTAFHLVLSNYLYKVPGMLLFFGGVRLCEEGSPTS